MLPRLLNALEAMALDIRVRADPVVDAARRACSHPTTQKLLAVAKPCLRVLYWLAPFIVLYNMYQRAWDWLWRKAFQWVWMEAFPMPRTRLIIFMVILPAWGALMASALILIAATQFLLSFVVARTRTRIYLPLATVEMERMLSEDDSLTDVDNEPPIVKPRALSMRRPRSWHLCWWSSMCIYVSLAFAGVYLYRTYEQPDDIRFRPQLELAVRNPRPQGYGKREKVFIAALFYNSQEILPRWTDEMTRVIHYIGTDNCFVSIMESWSWDRTPQILEEFAQKLTEMGVQHRILVRDTIVPRPSNMRTQPPRIKFLADSRNRVLEPLVERGGYDRIIYSNDIFVKAEGIVELLNSRDGDYDQVCAFDYSQWGVCDGWVMRDRYGGFVSSIWPYFTEETGARAVMAGKPAPVMSCWNGIVAMRAEPFLPPELRNTTTIGARLSASKLPYKIPFSHPAAALQDVPPREQPALKFRSSEPKECFSSECFLIPYDMTRQYGLTGIYMNPLVTTAYVYDHFVWYNYVLRHWVVRWWIEKVENGQGIHLAKWIVGNKDEAYLWDGGACQVFDNNNRPETSLNKRIPRGRRSSAQHDL